MGERVGEAMPALCSTSSKRKSVRLLVWSGQGPVRRRRGSAILSRISAVGELLAPPRTPELAPHPLMQALVRTPREPVAERLQENRAW